MVEQRYLKYSPGLFFPCPHQHLILCVWISLSLLLLLLLFSSPSARRVAHFIFFLKNGIHNHLQCSEWSLSSEVEQNNCLIFFICDIPINITDSKACSCLCHRVALLVYTLMLVLIQITLSFVQLPNYFCLCVYNLQGNRRSCGARNTLHWCDYHLLIYVLPFHLNFISKFIR